MWLLVAREKRRLEVPRPLVVIEQVAKSGGGGGSTGGSLVAVRRLKRGRYKSSGGGSKRSNVAAAGDRCSDRSRDIFLRSPPEQPQQQQQKQQLIIRAIEAPNTSANTNTNTNTSTSTPLSPITAASARSSPTCLPATISSMSKFINSSLSSATTFCLISPTLLLHTILFILVSISATLFPVVSVVALSNSIDTTSMLLSHHLMNNHQQQPSHQMHLILWPNSATTTTSGSGNTKEQKVSNFSEQQQLSLKKSQEQQQQIRSIYQDLDIDLEPQRKKESSATENTNGDEHSSRADTLRWKRSLDVTSQPDGNEVLLIDHHQRRYASSRGNTQRVAIDALHRGADQRRYNLANRHRRLQPGTTTGEPIDYQQLLAFWTYVKGAYPSLASHLFTLSMGQSNDEIQNQPQQQERFEQIARAVAHLLGEADRLARGDQATGGADLRRAVDSLLMSRINQQQQYAKHHNLWLSRVLSNPKYAKLVQYFNNQRPQQMNNKPQQRQQPTVHNSRVVETPLPSTGSTPPFYWPTPMVGGGQESLTMNGSQRAATNDQLQVNTGGADTHVYGRIVHYPHEIGAGEPPVLPTKTLDKLRQLNNHRTQQQPSANEISDDSGSGANSIDELESNRIPLIASDGGPAGGWAEGRARQHQLNRPTSETDDSARNKFVYGSVMLRPNEIKEDTKGQQQQQQRGAFRQLSDNLDRNSNNDNDELLPVPTTPPGGLNQKQTLHSEAEGVSIVEPTSESYGRILVNPPSGSLLDSQQQQVSSNNDYDNNNNNHYHQNSHQQHLLHNTNERQTGDGEQQSSVVLGVNSNNNNSNNNRWNKLTLDRLRQQLDQFGGYEPNNRNLDELATQQHGSSVVSQAVPSSGIGAGASPSAAIEAGNEFEGIWHHGPLQQVELRQLRVDEHNNGQQIIHTTSSSRDVFLVD